MNSSVRIDFRHRFVNMERNVITVDINFPAFWKQGHNNWLLEFLEAQWILFADQNYSFLYTVFVESHPGTVDKSWSPSFPASFCKLSVDHWVRIRSFGKGSFPFLDNVPKQQTKKKEYTQLKPNQFYHCPKLGLVWLTNEIIEARYSLPWISGIHALPPLIVLLRIVCSQYLTPQKYYTVR